MSSVLKRAGNYNPAPTRAGPPLGQRFSLDKNDRTEDDWYRFLPSGDMGAKTSETELALGTLPDGFLPCDCYDWLLKILNEGYLQNPIRIEAIDDSGGCKLQDKIQFYDALPTDVEWVIYPELLFPFTVYMDQQSSTFLELDVGWLSEDTYKTPDDKVRELYPLEKESFQSAVQIPTTQVDRMVYKFPRLLSLTIMIFGWCGANVDIG